MHVLQQRAESEKACRTGSSKEGYGVYTLCEDGRVKVDLCYPHCEGADPPINERVADDDLVQCRVRS